MEKEQDVAEGASRPRANRGPTPGRSMEQGGAMASAISIVPSSLPPSTTTISCSARSLRSAVRRGGKLRASFRVGMMTEIIAESAKCAGSDFPMSGKLLLRL